ncbi:MAG: response regulator [Verrucomicrobiales bacterium]|nr:response regulator [Verrucomicrobiales bacterium]
MNPPRRILVVEDNLAIRQLNTEVLTDSGYQVDAAENGAVAWAALQLFDYDLLITDNEMPNVTGVDLLKKLHAASKSLPAIMVSGTMPTEELNREPWLQIVERVVKPYSLSKFLETVEKVLRAADAAREPFVQRESLSVGKSAGTPIARGLDSFHRILVVDDDSDTRQLSMDVLAGSGYDVDGAKDGADGWASLQTCDYDLVITDNKMPRMTGLEMIEKLRSSTMAVPVIMATSYLPAHEFARKPWLKPDVVLERPFSNEDLLEAVKTILGTGDGNAGHQETLFPKHL